MAARAADGGSEGQIAVTEDELRELNNQVRSILIQRVVTDLDSYDAEENYARLSSA